MATSYREEFRKVLTPRCGKEKARMIADRTSPEKARLLTQRWKDAGK